MGNHLEGDAGVTILELLVGASIATMLIMMLASVYQFSFATDQSINRAYDKQDLKRFALTRVSCEQNAHLNSCYPGSKVHLNDVFRKKIINAKSYSPTKFGRFIVKAECTKSGSGAIITVDDKPLFPQGVSFCKKAADVKSYGTRAVAACKDCNRVQMVSGYTLCGLTGTRFKTHKKASIAGCYIKSIDRSKGQWALYSSMKTDPDNNKPGHGGEFKCSMHCIK